MARYALIVGIGKYSDPEITDLTFAAQDAADVGSCLQDICGFDGVRVLASGGAIEPDHVNIIDALDDLAPRLFRDDLFLFYFAGHGIETRLGAHLLTANSRIRYPELASISKNALAECLSRIECADRVLILDACRNDPRKGMGNQDNPLTAGFSRDIMAIAETPVEGVIPATCVLFSCRQGERAYEWPAEGHGAFTHFLLEGLRGASRDGLGRVTVQRLGQYVQERVPAWSRKTRTPHPQTPWAEQVGGLREIVLADRLAGPGTSESTEPRHRRTTQSIPTGWTTQDRRIKVATPAGDVSRVTTFYRSPMDFEFVRIPAGEFIMGDTLSPEEVTRNWPSELLFFFKAAHPAHRVRITRSILLGATAVTRGQFARFVEDSRYVTDAERTGGGLALKNGRWLWQTGVSWKDPMFQQTDQHPVVCVSWNDARAFCAWLAKQVNAVVRLPTEAEWEYAARAGSDEATWYWGDEEQGAQGRANVPGEGEALNWEYSFKGVRDGHTFTAPVAQFAPNAFGLYDVIGNVWEWCQDGFDPAFYGISPMEDPLGLPSGKERVLRGGFWGGGPAMCRTACRNSAPTYSASSACGFRVVVDLEQHFGL